MSRRHEPHFFSLSLDLSHTRTLCLPQLQPVLCLGALTRAWLDARRTEASHSRGWMHAHCAPLVKPARGHRLAQQPMRLHVESGAI